MLCRIVWYNFKTILEDAAAFVVRLHENYSHYYYYYYYSSRKLSCHSVAVVLTLILSWGISVVCINNKVGKGSQQHN
jgi:hypothetical protein